MPLDVVNPLAKQPETTIEVPEKVIDTSLVYLELVNEYKKKGAQLEIDFRRLVNWVKLGDQYTHQIHPYPAKLLPNIANFFINASCLRGRDRTVLDPFCGSGTVALESSLSGLTPLIADANPLALLIAKVKTTPYDTEELYRYLQETITRFSKIRNAPKIKIVNDSLWYSKSRKSSLERLKKAISEIENEDIKDFFNVCFSSLSRKLSYSDPAISVPVRLREKEKFSDSTNKKIKERLKWIEKANTKDEFQKLALANINRVKVTNFQFPLRKSAQVVGTDARNLLSESNGISGAKVSLIVTSPPYGSAQKYIRASSLSLNWLEMAPPDKLSYFEGKSIGREHLPKFRETPNQEDLPIEFEETIARISRKNKLRGRITRRYLSELKCALEEMTRVLNPDGHIILVIGNNEVCGEVLRNDEYIKKVLIELGLSLELNLIDHIKSRGLMTKRNKTASLISREVVLVFRK